MAMKDYLDPRWQKLRLKILERDRFKCMVCQDKDSTLHVHHRVYEKKKKIWEAKPDNLVTLCEKCHERCEKIVQNARRYADAILFNQSSYCEEGEDIAETHIETLFRVIPFYGEEEFHSAIETHEDLLAFFDSAAEKASKLMLEKSK